MNNFGIARTGQTVLFGWGQRHALPRLVKPLGNRAFICTDDRFPQDPLLSALATDMRSEGIAVEVYDATVAELPLDCILDATSQARAFGPAVVVGIGGGSCMDLAKLVALALSHSGEMSAFYGEFKVPAPVLPVIAIPTTAGTGSEVTPVAVLADPARDMKVGISSPYPRHARSHCAAGSPSGTLIFGVLSFAIDVSWGRRIARCRMFARANFDCVKRRCACPVAQ
ncbi:iron-containing alcohol dehydrogenase [Paraburkholderia sp. GAS82]|uniref:iron-containing alcohol dehydrogenase n=1 Tax=Paraburkholderia sp. GAS82 TaxID=3035137 RepID=UPI003D211802